MVHRKEDLERAAALEIGESDDETSRFNYCHEPLETRSGFFGR